MTLKKRDRWVLVAGAVSVLLILVWRFGLSEGQAPEVVAAPDSLPRAEKRLGRARQLAAALPTREQALKVLSAELAEREKGVIQADTLAQAQAQLMQIMRRVASSQPGPIEIRSAETGQARPLGEEYGEIAVPMSFDCRIDQLVNLLADLTAQPELIATSELRISMSNQKHKIITVRLVLSGVVPRKLVPARRGPGLL